jgi:hypothetical protein
MFQPVAEMIASHDMVQPASGYPALYEEWREECTESLGVFLAEDPLTAKESKSFEVGKEVAFAALQKFLKMAGSVAWAKKSTEERLEHVAALMARPQVPQRTPAWYAQGKEVLTASEFSGLFGSPRAVGQLVLSKVPCDLSGSSPAPTQTNRPACMSCEMTSLDWGVRFEPVVKQILAERWGAAIQDTGRLLHPTDPRIAASPDGILMAATEEGRIGRLVEIKCPIRREVGEGVPFEYWCQMQLQMEVTGIDECEYVEVKLASPQKGQADLSGAVPDGFVWLLQNGAAAAELKYAYTIQERAEAEAAGWELVETIPWILKDFYTKTIVRDRAWFQSTAAARADFWEKVEAARHGEFVCPEPSRKSTKTPKAAAVGPLVVNVCKILDD